jgi:hypothetical protein
MNLLRSKSVWESKWLPFLDEYRTFLAESALNCANPL